MLPVQRELAVGDFHVELDSKPHRFVCGDRVQVIHGNGADRHLIGTEGILKGRIGPGKSKARIELRDYRGNHQGQVIIDIENIKLIKSAEEIREEQKLEEEYGDEEE